MNVEFNSSVGTRTSAGIRIDICSVVSLKDPWEHLVLHVDSVVAN